MYLLVLLGAALATASLFFKQKWPLALLALASFAGYFQVWQGNGLVPFIILSVGVFIVILEFYLPQTGFAGIIGSLVVALVLHYWTQDWQQTWLLLFGIWLVGVAVLFICMKLGWSVQANEAFILDAQITSHARKAAATTPQTHPLIGASGRTVSDLKPVGKVEIDGQIYDARSGLDFISQGETVQVLEVNQGTLVVRQGSADA